MNERVAIPSDAAMSLGDLLGIIRVRLGFGRASYRVAPGLYSVGSPDARSPVLVSANYKYSFDLLRSSLSGVGCASYILQTWIKKDKAQCGCGKSECC